jgi:hypothetical protein
LMGLLVIIKQNLIIYGLFINLNINNAIVLSLLSFL